MSNCYLKSPALWASEGLGRDCCECGGLGHNYRWLTPITAYLDLAVAAASVAAMTATSSAGLPPADSHADAIKSKDTEGRARPKYLGGQFHEIILGRKMQSNLDKEHVEMLYRVAKEGDLNLS